MVPKHGPALSIDAHTLMSTQAFNSPLVRGGIKNILLNHAQLYETLRGQAGADPSLRSG